MCIKQVCIYSGPVLALALGRTGAVYLWKNILGPSDVNEAKDENPEWWVMWGSMSHEVAVETLLIEFSFLNWSDSYLGRTLYFFWPLFNLVRFFQVI